MKTVNRDFFYFEPSADRGFSDFTNNDEFSPKQRWDFLSHYSDFLKKYYNIPDESAKPVTEEKAKQVCENVSVPVTSPKISKRIDIKKMTAELYDKISAYENWNLYTKGSVIEGNTVIMKGDPLLPNPAASYILPKSDNAKEFYISFFIEDEVYDNRLSENGIPNTDLHRIISVRSGVKEIININIYPNGVCSILSLDIDVYRPKRYDLGRVECGKWHTLNIKLTDEAVSAVIDKNEPTVLDRKVADRPDLLFFGAGMSQMGRWTIKLQKIVCENGEITDFFKPSAKNTAEILELGTVTVPFSVGNYKNRDKILRLKKEFEAESTAKAYLTVGSIDPGGRVYLDGELIAETDGFEQLKIDITEKLKKQNKHNLVIEVDPRAPEMLFGWHRKVDSYIGWFCEDVTVDLINDIEITDAKAVTIKAGRGKATAALSCKTSEPCKVKVYFAETWPCKSAEKLLGTYDSDGNMSATVNLDKINLWSTEDPVLYDVRFEALNQAGLPIDDTVIETGFRTVEQKNGAIYINGVKTTMKGALLMQYLPLHYETAGTHICPRDWQIVWQYMVLKGFGGNILRLHILGYGTNDIRFARYADRLGLMLVWTTRYISAVEQMEWEGSWRALDGYLGQISQRLNHPSIVIWQGSNAFNLSSEALDRIHESFVSAVKSVDTSRLICPFSHHGYAESDPDASLYNDCSTDGLYNAFARELKDNESCNDPLVVRFNYLYNYYKFLNGDNLGFKITEDGWRISQAYQSLCISYAVRKFRIMDFEGILWCCFMGRANDADYLKPPIDNYGYAKYGFYTMKEYFKTITCLNDTDETKRGKGFAVKPVLFAFPGDTRTVTASVIDENGNETDRFVYKDIEVYDYITRLPEWKPNIEKEGYYAIQFIVK